MCYLTDVQKEQQVNVRMPILPMMMLRAREQRDVPALPPHSLPSTVPAAKSCRLSSIPSQLASHNITEGKHASSQNRKTELMSHKSILFQYDWNQPITEKLPRNSWTHFIGKIPVWKSNTNGCHEFGKLCTNWKKLCFHSKRSRLDVKPVERKGVSYSQQIQCIK